MDGAHERRTAPPLIHLYVPQCKRCARPTGGARVASETAPEPGAPLVGLGHPIQCRYCGHVFTFDERTYWYPVT